VKVVLSGQGADEMFAGYHWFQKIGLMPAQHAPQTLYGMLADWDYEGYQSLVQRDYHAPNYALAYLEALCAAHPSEHLLTNLLEYESSAALSAGPLCRVDNMTMASSLEARVPFLDEEVVNLAARMPLSLKLKDGGKYMLKKLGRSLLPAEVVDRPKGYFPVPALKYLHGPTLELMRNVLSPQRLAARGLFQPAAIQHLLDAPDTQLTQLGASKLWQVGLLEYWLQQQGL
jgi:asparagine synthase (glutamine-hydrolysing)